MPRKSNSSTKILGVPLADGDGTRAAYVARYYPMAEVGTVSSGGVYAVMTEWVGG